MRVGARSIRHVMKISVALCVFLTAVTAPAGPAAVRNKRATLSGSQVVPPNGSPATGSARVRIDTQLSRSRAATRRSKAPRSPGLASDAATT